MQAVRRHDAGVVRQTTAREARVVAPVAANPGYQAFFILRIGFTVAPIVAGLDKFANLLGDWSKYLAPVIPKTLGVAPVCAQETPGAATTAGAVTAGAVTTGGATTTRSAGGATTTRSVVGTVTTVVAAGGTRAVVVSDE